MDSRLNKELIEPRPLRTYNNKDHVSFEIHLLACDGLSKSMLGLICPLTVSNNLPNVGGAYNPMCNFPYWTPWNNLFLYVFEKKCWSTAVQTQDALGK